MFNFCVGLIHSTVEGVFPSLCTFADLAFHASYFVAAAEKIAVLYSDCSDSAVALIGYEPPVARSTQTRVKMASSDSSNAMALSKAWVFREAMTLSPSDSGSIQMRCNSCMTLAGSRLSGGVSCKYPNSSCSSCNRNHQQPETWFLGRAEPDDHHQIPLSQSRHMPGQPGMLPPAYPSGQSAVANINQVKKRPIVSLDLLAAFWYAVVSADVAPESTAYQKAVSKSKETNGRLFIRLTLATADCCPQGYTGGSIPGCPRIRPDWDRVFLLPQSCRCWMYPPQQCRLRSVLPPSSK